MSKPGLLESVRKYHPREGSDPLENFITEAFAWILRECSEFGDAFVNFVSPGVLNRSSDQDELLWSTQENFSGKFPDMVCTCGNKALVFEHKTWSAVHSDQISNYKNFASSNYDDYRVVLISASKRQHIDESDEANYPDIQKTWEDIYAFSSNWIESNSTNSLFVEEFICLLLSVGLGPSAPISQEAIRCHFITQDLRKQISELLKKIDANDWQSDLVDIFTNIENPTVVDIRGSYYGEQYGRMGVHLKISKAVTVFIGFVLEERDLGALTSERHKGPDMILAVIFDRAVHKHYATEPTFKKTTDCINKLMVDGKNGWQWYDNISDDLSIEKNPYVPFQIRKPMLDVFMQTKTTEDQSIEFMRAGKELLGIVGRCKSFHLLCEALDQYIEST